MGIMLLNLVPVANIALCFITGISYIIYKDYGHAFYWLLAAGIGINVTFFLR